MEKMNLKIQKKFIKIIQIHKKKKDKVGFQILLIKIKMQVFLIKKILMKMIIYQLISMIQMIKFY